MRRAWKVTQNRRVGAIVCGLFSIETTSKTEREELNVHGVRISPILSHRSEVTDRSVDVDTLTCHSYALGTVALEPYFWKSSVV